MESKTEGIPKAFIWRRLHSLAGLWLVLFLMEHLVTNSQAALLLGDTGKGFVRAVNFLHNLPYLQVIEIGLLGIPILLHAGFGIKYALTSKGNSGGSDGSKPSLKYKSNKAYTWQRITSWILLFLLALHVVKFRFIEYPESVNTGTQNPTYFVTVKMDPGLYTVADRLGVKLYDQKELDGLKSKAVFTKREESLQKAASAIRENGGERYSSQDELILKSAQSAEEKREFASALSSVELPRGDILAASPTFGTATLLTVRETFSSPFWVAVYTVFVLSACFHAFNGLWTSMLTWGWVIKMTAQVRARAIAVGLMVVIAALGLIAIWGTYFINLKH